MIYSLLIFDQGYTTENIIIEIWNTSSFVYFGFHIITTKLYKVLLAINFNIKTKKILSLM